MSLHRVRTFFALTLLVSFTVGTAVAMSSRGQLPLSLPASLNGIIILSPAGVALILVHREQGAAGVARVLRGLAVGRVPVRWYLLALLAPAAINTLALSIYNLLGGTVPSLPGAPAAEQQAIPLAVLPLLLLLLSAGEEIGWRGYALPRLQANHSALIASLAIGVVWAVWHLPLSMPAESTQAQLPFGWYLVGTTAMAVLFTWIANSTGGSLLLVTLFHASIQATNFLLPVWPGTIGDTRAYQLSVVVTVLVALVVVLTAGPRELTRRRDVRVSARPAAGAPLGPRS